MNDKRRTRVVVWLDPTAPQEASLQVLAPLGADAEILGLFVEDLDLLDLSRLSVAREITFDGPAAQELSQDRTEQQFRAHGARMRSMFEAAARKIAARHSFRVARGVLRTELLKLAADYDTLVLSHSRRQFGPRLTIRAQLGELLVGGPRTLVFVQERWSTGQRIVAMFDGSPASEVALSLAATVAQSEHLGLSVWLPEDQADELKEHAVEMLAESMTYSLRAVATRDIGALVRAANSENARVIIVPAADPAETRDLVAGLLDRANCSVIVAR